VTQKGWDDGIWKELGEGLRAALDKNSSSSVAMIMATLMSMSCEEERDSWEHACTKLCHGYLGIDANLIKKFLAPDEDRKQLDRWRSEFLFLRKMMVDDQISIHDPMPFLEVEVEVEVESNQRSQPKNDKLKKLQDRMRSKNNQSLPPLHPKAAGYPPLCVAAQQGRLEMVVLLLVSGARSTCPCKITAAPTALHLAASGGFSDVSAALRAANGVERSEERSEDSIEDASLKRERQLDTYHDARGHTPLQIAVRAGWFKLVKELMCQCGDCYQMEGWGTDSTFYVCPSERTYSVPEDSERLVSVFQRAADIWEENCGRKLFSVGHNTNVRNSPGQTREEMSQHTYSIEVDFGEWNVKNGYTSPSVKPNRWPLKRCGAKVFLRKRRAEEVFPRSVEDALVATACHELGHVVGLPHHPDPEELMYFLGLPLGHGQGCKGHNFGRDCTAAIRWLYNPCLKTAVSSVGYPTICLKCFAPGWWNVRDRGKFLSVSPQLFASKAKPRRNPSTKRQVEILEDGSTRLLTTSTVDDVDEFTEL